MIENNNDQQKNTYNLDFVDSSLRSMSNQKQDFNFDSNRYLSNNLDELDLFPKDHMSRRSKPKKINKFLFACIFILIFFSGVALGYYKDYIGSGKNIVNTEWGQVSLDIPQSQDMVNVLAMGFDKGGYRTDTMMVISFNPKTSAVNLISIPRDILIGVNGSKMKLNAVFGIGKVDLTINAIRKLTGLPIHYYVAVDTTGFKNIIDALGGVQFDVPKDLKYSDPVQGLYIDLKKGPQLLDGNKAEQLVRFRKYPMADLDRGNVQKNFIKALIEQKLTLANVSDISKLKAIYDNINAYVKTNAGFSDFTKYSVSALKIKSDDFKTYTLPGIPKNIGGASYYIYDKKDTIDLFKEIMGKDIEPKFDLYPNIEIYDTENIDIKMPQKKIDLVTPTVDDKIEKTDSLNTNNSDTKTTDSKSTTKNDTTKSGQVVNQDPTKSQDTTTTNKTGTTNQSSSSTTQQNTSTNNISPQNKIIYDIQN